MSAVSIPGTAVFGRVFASDPVPSGNGVTNRPLAGVIVTVDGAEERLRATTDENGFFNLSPSPAGRFFVHIDGRPAFGSEWPSGDYYPFVGKAFEAIAGSTNNPAGGTGEIFLPLVKAGTLRAVSASQSTTIGFPPAVLAEHPELGGVSITVPPNALYGDNGARGGSVGIAPVAPDRIPSPLPAGLAFPLVITVQTDGPMNFDQPVEVRFPNLPDPRTGHVLAPGEKSVLWSYNHDSGHWEPQGTMTVSADGRFLVSDPGMGIRQPGWHGPTAAWPPMAPPNSCSGLELASEYLEWQLKSAECALRMAGLLLAPKLDSANIFVLIQSASGMVGALPTLAESLVNLRAAIESGSPAAGLEALLGVVQAELEVIQPLADKLFSRPSDAELLKNGVADLGVCVLEMMKEQLDFSCQVVPCVMGDHPNIAQQEAFCDAVRAGISGLLATIEAYQFKNGDAFSRLSTGIEHLRPLLTAFGGGSARLSKPVAGIAGPRPASASTRDELLVTIQEAISAAQELQEDLQPTADLAREGIALLNTYSNYLAEVEGAMLLRLNAHSNAFFKLTSAGFETRNRTTASGTMALPGVNLTESYTMQIYDPLRNAVSDGHAPAPGIASLENLGNQPIYLPDPVLRLPGINDLSGDTDGDGLTDLAEEVIGTRPDVSDTDSDGVSDWAEVQQGQDPLSGIALPVGPVAGLSLAGVARAIEVSGTTAYLALGFAGMAMVDVAEPLRPIAIMQFALPGYSRDIAVSSRARTVGVLAYVDSDQSAQGYFAQVHVVDVADPVRPRLVRTFFLAASSITEDDGIYYLAVENQVRMYDAVTGLEVGWFAAAGRITGVRVAANEIFVTTDTTLAIYEKALASPALKGLINGKFAAADIESSVPMVLDGTRLWVGTATGLLAVDVSNHGAPVILNQPGLAPRACRTLALSAGKRAVCLTTFTPNSVGFGGQVSVYDISDPTSNNRLGLLLNGLGSAQDAAMMSGWLILADGLAGLTIVNLLPLDAAGQPPVIIWSMEAQDMDPSKPGVQRVESRRATVHPVITDDVEVERTELLVDGIVVDVSRVIPPMLQYWLPTRASGATQIDLQIRSRDRSGNESLSEAIPIELVPDSEAPGVMRPSANSGFAAFSGWPLVFRFTEELGAGAWQASSMTLMNLGADGAVGGNDDTVVPITAASSLGAAANIMPTSPLSVGRYRLTIPKDQIRDTVGNTAGTDLALDFPAFAVDPATAVWLSSNPGRFLEPTNWLHARVPSQEDVLIQLPGTTPAVTLDGRAITRNLTVAGPLSGTNRSVSLTVRVNGQFRGPVQWNGGGLNFFPVSTPALMTFEQSVTLTGSALVTQGRMDAKAAVMVSAGGSLELEGTNAQLTLGAGIELVNATLTVRSGAVFELPQIIQVSAPGDFTPLFPIGGAFRAQGIGSRLALPNLASASGPLTSNIRGSPALRFDAVSGGELQLPKLATLTGRTVLTANGEGSLLDAPALTSDVGTPGPATAMIEASDLGRVRVPSLITVENCTITERTGGVVER
jgi:hypothetical protein